MFCIRESVPESSIQQNDKSTQKDVFSLRDEISTCPNIEVNIEVTDNSPFFTRPYHVKEEDGTVLDKEMRRLCYLGILILTGAHMRMHVISSAQIFAILAVF